MDKASELIDNLFSVEPAEVERHCFHLMALTGNEFLSADPYDDLVIEAYTQGYCFVLALAMSHLSDLEVLVSDTESFPKLEDHALVGNRDFVIDITGKRERTNRYRQASPDELNNMLSGGWEEDWQPIIPHALLVSENILSFYGKILS